MLLLDTYPKNGDKVEKLISFFGDILSICEKINVQPILDGSLAVFLYTKNLEIEVNDIDLSYPEKYYQIIADELNGRGIDAQIKEWHVLQARRDDLKVEFGNTDFWYPGISIEPGDYVQIDKHQVKVLKLESLLSFYRIGLNNLKDDKEKEKKYNDLKVKYELLKAVKVQV